MIDCPYKAYGCTYQAPNHYDMEDHLIAMSHTDDATHNPTDPIRSFKDLTDTDRVNEGDLP